jgi:hypothetical protein
MAKCPICKRPIPSDAADTRPPFCSQRCKLADLHGWLSGRYVVSEPLDSQQVVGSPDSEDEFSQP